MKEGEGSERGDVNDDLVVTVTHKGESLHNTTTTSISTTETAQFDENHENSDDHMADDTDSFIFNSNEKSAIEQWQKSSNFAETICEKSANKEWKKSSKYAESIISHNGDDTCSDYVNDEEYYSDDSFVTIDDDNEGDETDSSGADTDDTLAYESNSTDSAIGIESFCVNPYFVST